MLHVYSLEIQNTKKRKLIHVIQNANIHRKRYVRMQIVVSQIFIVSMLSSPIKIKANFGPVAKKSPFSIPLACLYLLPESSTSKKSQSSPEKIYTSERCTVVQVHVYISLHIKIYRYTSLTRAKRINV